MTIDQLIEQLAAEGHLAPDQRSAAAALLAQQERAHEQPTPWYLRGLVGVGAWIAAALLVAFWSTLLLWSGSWSMVFLGLLGCGGAAALYHFAPHNLFLSQLSLAVSLAGQVQVAIGLGMLDTSATVVALAIVLLELVLLLAHPDMVLRFLATIAIVLSLVVVLWDWRLYEGLHLLVIALAVGAWLLWSREAEWVAAGWEGLARPVGYALPLALFGLLVVPFIDSGLVQMWWLSTAGLLLLLLWQVWGELRRQGATGGEPLALALLGGIALLGLPALQTPGLLAAFSMVVLGIERGNRLLLSIAVAFLALFVGQYYYQLELTLLVKSLVLLGTGAALLGLRFGLLRLVAWPEGRS